MGFQLTPGSTRRAIAEADESLESLAFATIIKNRMGRGGILNTVQIAYIPCTQPPQPPNSGGRNPKFLVISPQNWGVRGASAITLSLSEQYWGHFGKGR
jgi:hypothetical protein